LEKIEMEIQHILVATTLHSTPYFMRTQELTLQDHVRAVSQLVTQCETAGNSLERMRIVNEIFLYLAEYPRLVQDYMTFRGIVQRKINEFIVTTTRYKAVADPEGGVVDEPLLNAATNLENSINLLRQYM
jgi:hypothetical protein